MDFGNPLLAACLADGTAPKLPAALSWAALPPDALTSSRLAAGQVVLIGFTHRVVQPPQVASSPAAGRSPGPTHGSSNFGPSLELMVPEPATGLPPQPQSLWRLCSGRLGLPALADLDRSQVSSSGPAGRLPGTHLLPARVWPAAKLPRSTLLLSPAVRETAGQPPAGTVVLLYLPSAVAASGDILPTPLTPLSRRDPAADADAAAAAAAATAAAALPPPLTPPPPPPPPPPSAAITAGSPGAADTTRTGGAVLLQLCGEALLRAASSCISPDSTGIGTPAISLSRPAGERLASPWETPAGKGLRASGLQTVGGAGRSPAPVTPGTRTGGDGGGDVASVTAVPGCSLQQWPLDTLRRAADDRDEATRSALVAVARRHLAGRHLMKGAPLMLPVLGSSVVFRIAAALASLPAALSYGHGVAGGGGCSAMVEVRRDTQVFVLYPGESLPEQFAEDGGVDTAAGEMLERCLSLRGLPAGGSGIARQVALARESALAVVSESAAEAAADAAERALLAGMSAGGLDFSQLGGVDQHLRALRELVSLPLRAPQLFKQYGIRPPRGVLLYGPPGSGKTMLARAAAAEAGATVFLINGPDIVSEYFGESESSLKGIFAAASALAPSLVIMDEVDALAPARYGGGSGSSSHHSFAGGSDVASRLVTTLLTLLDGVEQAAPQVRLQPPAPQALIPHVPRPVVVVAATNRPDALDPALRRPGRLEREIEVGVPTAEIRLEILQARLRSVRHCLRPEDVAALAGSAHGFVSADLAALVDEAAMCGLRRRVAGRARRKQQEAEEEEEGPAWVTLDDFKTAETRVRPSALREVAVEIPAVRWDDIGGMHSVKQALREAVEWPHKAQSSMTRLGARAPRGVLLFGPPGCSKTLLARAVASEAQLNFIAVKGGELVSKYVGESEKAIAGLFARARATAPSIIFFDELDGLVGSRGGPEAAAGGGGGGAAGVSERLLSQLLTEMDGLMDRGSVTVLAATNRPDCLDPALLRPGRFDRLIHVPLPDKDARREILRVQLRRCPVAHDVDVGVLAVSTAGYSGADLAALVREAGIAALEEDLAAEQVTMRHFESALLLVQPSVPPSPELMAMYSRMQRAAVSVV